MLEIRLYLVTREPGILFAGPEETTAEGVAMQKRDPVHVLTRGKRLAAAAIPALIHTRIRGNR